MALNGYDINTAACQGILTNVEIEAEDIATKRSNLSDEVDNAVEACKSRQIGSALIDLWNNVLAIQCEAATTRIENAAGGVRGAVNAYVIGDEAMAENSRKQITDLPDISIEDAKK